MHLKLEFKDKAKKNITPGFQASWQGMGGKAANKEIQIIMLCFLNFKIFKDICERKMLLVLK